MSQFENSRRLSAPGGDGQNSDPTFTVNAPYKKGDRIPLATTKTEAPVFTKKNSQSEAKPVSVSYTKQTAQQIVDRQFKSAEEHEESIKGSKERVYLIIKCIKFLVMVAMMIGGGAFVLGWTPQDGTQISFTARIMSMIVFCVGPLIAFVLDHYLEKGVFFGLAKFVAWGNVIMVVVEEVMAMRAGRDPQFADFLMIEVGPWSLGIMLFSFILMGYLRSDLKRKRDLMQMRQKEEDTLAKNATGARQIKANKEKREQRAKKMGQFWTGVFETIFFTVGTPFLSIVRAWGNFRENGWAATEGESTKKKRTTSTKTKK